ncbi:gluconolaconase [Vreelandella venusta]|nr:gluconolaconase [Halomonas hydrothermalis]
MQHGKIEVAVKLEMSLGESPVWSAKHQTLHWVDINNGNIYSWNTQPGDAPSVISLDEKVGCVALAEEGLLAAAASGVKHLPQQGQAQHLADNAEWAAQGNRFNDGRCDAAGRLWVGTIAGDEASPTAALYCLEGGKLEKRLSAMGISNGLAFSPDQRWLYHTDSLTRCILRYPFDVATGELGQSEVFVDLEQLGLPGVPDGAAVDAEGYYWSALYGGGRIVRFSPSGDLVEEYAVPCPHPTMVAFGGDDLRSLYITTATQHLQTAEDKHAYPDAGSLFTMRVATPGLVEPSAQPLRNR